MKKRFSFSKFLYNDKLMMILSLLLAIVVWYSVLVGPANIAERTITVKVTVELDDNSYEGQRGLRVMGDNEFEVQVSIRGRWSIISRLTSEDLRASANLSVISGAGNVSVPISVDYNSDQTNYEIVSWSPRFASVQCDFWQEGTRFEVESDVSVLKVSNPENDQIGDPVIDKTAFPDGFVTIDGPKSTISKIHRVVARVAEERVLSVKEQLEAPLVALDEKGIAVDISSCTIKEVPGGVVRMTVPIWQSRVIKLGYTLVNKPDGVDAEHLLKLEPSEIEVIGPEEELIEISEQLKNLSTVDFRSFSLENPSVSFPLSFPKTVRAVEPPEAAVLTMDVSQLSEKTLRVEANQKNVVVKGLESGRKAVITPHVFEKLTIIGESSAIEAITEENISFEITPVNNSDRSKTHHTPQIKINGHDNVWVYMSDSLSEERIYVEIK